MSHVAVVTVQAMSLIEHGFRLGWGRGMQYGAVGSFDRAQKDDHVMYISLHRLLKRLKPPDLSSRTATYSLVYTFCRKNAAYDGRDITSAGICCGSRHPRYVAQLESVYAFEPS